MRKNIPVTFLVAQERIKSLAEECPEYRHAMEILFPEAFEYEVDFMVGDIVSADRSKQNSGKTGEAPGIVKVINPSMHLGIGIEFFQPMNGHTLDSDRATNGHGWWHAQEEVTLVFRPRKTKEK